MNNINNTQPSPEGNKPINNLFNKVKIFFANQLRSIATFLKIKKHIKIAKKATDIVPESLNIVSDIKVEEITNLEHTDPKTKQLDDYTLGEGVFGKVQVVALKKQNIAPVLIKKQFKDIPHTNIQASTEARIEHNKNIAFGDDSILDKNNSAIITRYKGESLRKLLLDINNEGPLPDNIKASISYQLLEQITNLHKQGIVHQDIKPANILIDSKGKLSIIDLAGALQNSSKQKDYSAKYNPSIYSPAYAPPEIYTQSRPKVTQYFDCWSAGVIMYELYTGKILLESCVTTKETEFYHNKIPKALRIANNELYTNKTIPPKIRNLILQLLTIDPNKRLTAEQALASEAFDDKRDIKKMTAIELNTTHDKHFKKLVELEVKLEKAKEDSINSLINELKKSIEDEKTDLLKLQQEIQRRNKNN